MKKLTHEDKEFLSYLDAEFGYKLSREERDTAMRYRKTALKINDGQPLNLEKKNAEFFGFLESEFGYKLSCKEKAHAIQCRNNLDKLNKGQSIEQEKFVATRPIRTRSKSTFFNNNLFRHFTTACLAIILCLSIVLPITLSGGNGDSRDPGGTIFQAQEHQFDLIREFYDVVDNRGFLFFNNYNDGDGETARAFYETDEDTGDTLSYIIRHLAVANNAFENFFFPVEFRIVVESEYEFIGYEFFQVQQLPLLYVVDGRILIRFFINTDTNFARIAFEYGDYRYFIHLVGDDDPNFLTIIDRDMIESLMRELILG